MPRSENLLSSELAMTWMESQPEEGLVSTKMYRSEENPNDLLIVQEWASHDAFHEMSDKYGDEFNRRAGTEGLDWRTGVWTA